MAPIPFRTTAASRSQPAAVSQATRSRANPAARRGTPADQSPRVQSWSARQQAGVDSDHHLCEEADQPEDAVDHDGRHLPGSGRGEDQRQPQARGEEQAAERLRAASPANKPRTPALSSRVLAQKARC
jgi:hypothetical protein